MANNTEKIDTRTRTRNFAKISNDNIFIKVIPSYIPREEIEDVEEKNNYFYYHVTIYNANPFKVQLISRYWLIINADGEEKEIEGAGVLGQNPVILPEQSFTYQNYCTLDTHWGTMEGFFVMMSQDGEVFKTKIKRFYLVTK